MKGFIEVTTEGGCSILLNVNCIEVISPSSTGGTCINTTSVYSKKTGDTTKKYNNLIILFKKVTRKSRR